MTRFPEFPSLFPSLLSAGSSKSFRRPVRKSPISHHLGLYIAGSIFGLANSESSPVTLVLGDASIGVVGRRQRGPDIPLFACVCTKAST